MSTQVAPAPSFTFTGNQENRFTWTLTDASGNPVTGATVKSTLYSGRNVNNVADFPGTADPIFNNLPMPEAPALSGIYSCVIPATFNPNPATEGGFVVVITALTGLSLIGQWTVEAVITPAANAIDLVLLSDVKAWLKIAQSNTDDDGLLQICITGFSRYVLNRTGRTSFGIETYTEIIDGNGAQQLFLRNYPITSVTSVTIGSYSAPQSTGLTIPGWYIDGHQKSIVMRSLGGSFQMVPYSISPQFFYQGRGNIQVIYTAGYAFLPEDLYEACMETIAVIYARKDWKDMLSRALAIQGGSGTTAFRKEFLAPGVDEIIRFYQRKALV